MRKLMSARMGVLCLMLAACSGGTTNLAGDAGGADGGPGKSGDGGSPGGGDGGGGMDASAGDGGTSSGDASAADGSGFEPIVQADGAVVFPTNEVGQVLCGTEVCTCNDGIDNDDDGLVDGFDPECTGPYDDDESSFATGIPGDNKDRFQDCFFDGNSGGGADDCKIDTVCILDRNSQECADSFTGQRTLESEEMKCENFCEPRTPNGCDCFGCCEVYVGDTVQNVLLDPTCEVEVKADGTTVVGDGCRSCTFSPVCGNECGECELCLGKEVQDLPESCAPAVPDGGVPDGGTDGGSEPPPAYECIDAQGNTQETCSPTDPCSTGNFCSQGCCIPILI